MSMDAFVAAIGKGTCIKKPRLSEAFRIGLIFGMVEGITPLLGWGLGQVAVEYASEWDHWIAFILLAALGLHMIYEGVAPTGAARPDTTRQHTFLALVITAFATSIDALAIGVGLAFVEVNICLAAAAIGVSTLLMVTIGIMVGHIIGTVLGKKAEIFGGLVLIAVGGSILYEHLSAVG